MESSSFDGINLSLTVGVIAKWGETKIRAHQDRFGPEDFRGFACSLPVLGEDRGELRIAFPGAVGADGKDWRVFLSVLCMWVVSLAFYFVSAFGPPPHHPPAQKK